MYKILFGFCQGIEGGYGNKGIPQHVGYDKIFAKGDFIVKG